MTQNKHSKYSVYSVKWDMIKSSGGQDTLSYTTDDKQKGTTVKNILITLLINTSSNFKGESYKSKMKVVCTTKHAFTVQTGSPKAF